MYTEIPLWEDHKWSTRTFETRDEFREFVLSLFKEPGQYEFDQTSFVFNEQARFFRTYGFFCDAPFKSRDYIDYWDDQKNKCRKGVIFKSGSKTWYLPRDYYMWLNFLPINDKEKRKFDFPEVRDAQYHLALYEVLAELHYKHCALLKKRQMASSYFHCAKLINQIWFEETPILKMGANLKDYINEKGSWKFLEEYRSFLNEHTAWFRPMNPGKTLMWQQQIEETSMGRTHKKGLKGVLQGVTFEKNPTAGVGGATTIFFYEEAGIAPTMHITVEFLFPAMRDGQITTGLFIAAGSVGDLEQCNPLREMILYPASNDIYPVTTNLIDDKGNIAQTGLFIPEQWSMPPFIDQYGNSLVAEALESLLQERVTWKQTLSPEKYQYRISQHPINIEEAFANRKVSKFPLALVSTQMHRIQEKEYPYEFVDLEYDGTGRVIVKDSRKLPVTEFPIRTDMIDKEGVIIIWERPVDNPEFGLYYASVDPISEGKTSTSESLCSIYIYKNPVEVTKVIDQDHTETFIEQDKIVASWCGRFDDINKTHERLAQMIQLYNAWTVVENNVTLFIQYMIQNKMQKFLVPKDQIMFLKDLGSNASVFQDYGWRNTGTIFRVHLLSFLVEFLKEEIGVITKDNGEVVKRHYGIERIPDMMALKEMQLYTDDLNVDRLVALAALVAFAKVQQSNRGYRKRVEMPKNLEMRENLYKLSKRDLFKHMGQARSRAEDQYRVRRSAFKNIR